MTNTAVYEYDFTARGEPAERKPHSEVSRQQLARAFCRPLSPVLADLLDIVMAVYAADRRSPRNYRGVHTGQRQIAIQVGVRCIQTWNDPAILDRLHNLLRWLSEDEWTLCLRDGDYRPTLAESQQFLLSHPVEEPSTVSLFSGGLDSLAGLASCAQRGAGSTTVLVSGYTHSRLEYQQREQFRSIKHAWRLQGLSASPSQVRHLMVPFNIRKPEDLKEEASQRTRALVYLAFGVTAAVLSDTSTLNVYENGVGALNLPSNETQLGVDNYRGVHPRSLILAEDLFTTVLRQEIHIRNPFLFTTKAEMCRALEPAGLAGAVGLTVSCDGFPQRQKNSPSQCGYCTSCILRRQAIFASGIPQHDDRKRYRMDALSWQGNLDSEHRYGLNAMRNQVHGIANCMSAPNPWGALISLYPELARTQLELAQSQVYGAGTFKEGILRLFGTYVQEWQPFM